jgi:hypothetical protein
VARGEAPYLRSLIVGVLVQVTGHRLCCEPRLCNRTQDPLKLWDAIVKTHKSGTHHHSAESARIKLMNDLVGCRQRHSETLEEFTQRFKTVARAYQDAADEAGTMSEADLAGRFCSALHPVRNATSTEEILRRECNGTAMPTSVDTAVALAQSYLIATAASSRVGAYSHQAVAYAAETDRVMPLLQEGRPHQKGL